ncbi:MAG: hypothetical protein ACYC0T_14955 [Ramlibacter sp.]
MSLFSFIRDVDADQDHAILATNRPMLSHPDRIYPGQKLRIPKLA